MNAAFQHNSSDAMGNTNDTLQVSPQSSSSPSNESASQQKTTVKLSRTLTEKRKDYVRRVSAVKKMPDNNVPANDSSHQTFKPSVFRTFSVDNTDDETLNDSISSNSTTAVSPKGVERSFDRKGIADDQSAETDVADVDTNNHSEKEDEINDNLPKLFQVCLLIGFNISTRQAYIKSKFPADEDIPPNIEQLVFPSPNLISQTRNSQDYR